MRIPLFIEKDSKKDCSYKCIFRTDGDKPRCNLFNEDLENIGYYDSREHEAVYRCQQLWDDAKKCGRCKGTGSIEVGNTRGVGVSQCDVCDGTGKAKD